MWGDPRLAEEARQDSIVVDADEWAMFLAAVERDAQREARRRRLANKAKRARFH